MSFRVEEKLFIDKDQFIELLKECKNEEIDKINPINAILISINNDNFFNYDEYYNEYNNKTTWANISESELRTKLGISPFLKENYKFEGLILLLLFSLFVFGLISFLIEPFIVKKKPLEITKVESTKKTLGPKLNAKFITNKLISYFIYDGSYISGNRYCFRKILQWPLIFLLIGFYLRAVTTYYRCKSLKISVFNSYLFGIYSIFIDFYIILVIPFNEKFFGVVPEMQWVFIFPTLPFAYLIFMDGKNNNSNVVEENIINTEEISKDLIETNFNISIQKKENNLNNPFFLKLNEFLTANSTHPILIIVYRIILRVVIFFIVFFTLFIIPFNLNANWLIPFTTLIAFFVTKPISNYIITNWLPALEAK